MNAPLPYAPCRASRSGTCPLRRPFGRWTSADRAPWPATGTDTRTVVPGRAAQTPAGSPGGTTVRDAGATPPRRVTATATSRENAPGEQHEVQRPSHTHRRRRVVGEPDNALKAAWRAAARARSARPAGPSSSTRSPPIRACQLARDREARGRTPPCARPARRARSARRSARGPRRAHAGAVVPTAMPACSSRAVARRASHAGARRCGAARCRAGCAGSARRCRGRRCAQRSVARGDVHRAALVGEPHLELGDDGAQHLAELDRLARAAAARRRCG